MWIAAPTYLGGGNGLNLTQDAVDAFYMVDGKDINASSTKYPYPSSSIAGDAIGGSDLVFSGFTLKNQTAKMYHNREMRFYATVGFCHSFWPGTSYTGSDASLKIRKSRTMQMEVHSQHKIFLKTITVPDIPVKIHSFGG